MPVAELVAIYAGDALVRYEFGYIQGARQALALGFQPFLAFPYLSRRYEGTELFPFFRNRILSRTRPDYSAHVEALGLSVQTATAIDLLGRSEGRRHTDRIETVLVAERDPETDRYVTWFLLRGVRHIAGAEATIERMKEGAPLEPRHEPTNASNPRARILRFDGRDLGYVADYLLADLDALEAAQAGPRFTVARLNPPPHPAHYRVLVRMDAGWPQGFEPCDGPEFRPYDGDEVEPTLPMVV